LRKINSLNGKGAARDRAIFTPARGERQNLPAVGDGGRPAPALAAPSGNPAGEKTSQEKAAGKDLERGSQDPATGSQLKIPKEDLRRRY
jgi:hypothetical protein